MTLHIDTIPAVDEKPTSTTEKSVVKEALSALVGRRPVLRFAGGLGMTAGLTMIGWIKPMRTAFAGPDSRYDAHPDCAGYYNPSTTCTPPEWYISSNVCNNVNFHRDDGGSGTCYNFRHTVNFTSCGGLNAWHWGNTRCSDGHYVYNDCGGGHADTPSICRGDAI